MTSLKTTLLRQLSAVTIVIVLVYTLLLYVWFFSGINFANESFMRRDSLRYQQWYQNDPTIVLPQDENFAVFLGYDNLPSSLQSLFPSDQLIAKKLSIANVPKPESLEPDKVILLMPTVVNNDRRLLYVVNTIQVSSDKKPADGLFYVVIVCASLILLLMFYFATRLYATIIKPLGELEKLAHKAANNQVMDSRLLEQNNEFGTLARTFAQSVDAINEVNQREKFFLQNVSHELRTPIAIVKSSLELIDKRLNAKASLAKIIQPLQRLNTANRSMEDLTEALLWLAKNSDSLTNDDFEFIPLCQQAWQQLQYLNDQSIELKLDSSAKATLSAPKALVSIVLMNLLRNGIEHNSGKIIELTFSHNQLIVSNPCREVANFIERGHSKQQGFGLGLSIVQQICDKQQWSITLDHFPHDDHQAMLTITILFG